MIKFSEYIGFYSIFIFWYVAVNAIATLLFSVVVTVGGFFDLRFLFKALKETPVDYTDDGRVESEPKQDNPKTEVLS